MFNIIRRLFTSQKLIIKFPIEKRNMTGYEEEFKPNPDYNKDELDKNKSENKKKEKKNISVYSNEKLSKYD